jgi:hypothetical protein
MTTLTKAQEQNLYSWCIQQGVNLEYGKLSLCDLRNFRHSQIRHDRRYQVHCDDVKWAHSMIYTDILPAVNKFIEIKSKIKRVK